MKTNDFNSQVTSDTLNESMFKKFGTRVDFDKYTREQLEDVRNKLRTKVNQTEGSAGFNELLSNEGYQQDKFMLNLINTRIKEMLGESKEIVTEKAKSKKQQKFMGMVYAAKKGKKPASPKVAKAAKGMTKKAARDFAKTKHKGLPKQVKEEDGVAFNKNDKNKHQTDSEAGAVTQQDENYNNPLPRTKRAIQARIDTGNRIRSQIDAQTLRPPREPKTVAQASQDRANAVRSAQAASDAEYRAARDAQRDANRPAGTKPIGRIKLLTRNNNMKTNEGKKAGAKPDYIDIDGDGNKKEPMKAAADSMRKKKTKGSPFGKSKATPAKPKKDTDNPFAKGKGPRKPKDNSKGKNPFAKNKKKSVKESSAKNYAIIIEGLKRFINEDEEGKAKDITAGSDMVNDFTSWMQRVGQYQTKSMIELSDSIRSNFGQAEAEAFKNAIAPALQSALDSLSSSREVISKAVAVLAGEEAMSVPMGSEEDMSSLGIEEPTETEADSMNVPAEDEFTASDAAVGGRETRESRQFARLKKLDEAHSIMRKLAG